MKTKFSSLNFWNYKFLLKFTNCWQGNIFPPTFTWSVKNVTCLSTVHMRREKKQLLADESFSVLKSKFVKFYTLKGMVYLTFLTITVLSSIRQSAEISVNKK